MTSEPTSSLPGAAPDDYYDDLDDLPADQDEHRPQPFTFADLFAGIGGFHAALSAAGGRGWFASEIDAAAQQVYERNWGLAPKGDIRLLTEGDAMMVPPVDVLAAGFPCQPFSKSGFQRGMEETRGTLFWNIAHVLEARRPPVVLLENVRNLVGPNHRRSTFVTIIETLRDLGYRVSSEPTILSPHLLPPWLGGRPQVRERVFIVGTYVGPDKSRTKDALAVQPLASNVPVDGWDPHRWTLDRVLEHDDDIDGGPDRYRLTPADIDAISIWQEFLDTVLPTGPLPGFPIWADEFRWPALYPPDCPAWKRVFLDKNAALYRDHKPEIDKWRGGRTVATASRLAHLNASRRKLEWQAGRDPEPQDRDLWKTVMHFRPSGIRAKRPTYLPALVAITQTSIIGERRRRITPTEAARLQGLPDTFRFRWPAGPGGQERLQPDAMSYRQAGNGVNVGVAYWVLQQHVLRDAEILRESARHLVEAVEAAPDNPDEFLDPAAAVPAPATAESAAAAPDLLWSEPGGLATVLESGPRGPVRDLDRDMDLLAR